MAMSKKLKEFPLYDELVEKMKNTNFVYDPLVMVYKHNQLASKGDSSKNIMKNIFFIITHYSILNDHDVDELSLAYGAQVGKQGVGVTYKTQRMPSQKNALPVELSTIIAFYIHLQFKED